MISRLFGRSTVLLMIAALVTSCSSSAEPVPDKRAFLDLENQVIITPLSAYKPSFEETILIQQANAQSIAVCMNSYGLEYPRASADWKNYPRFPERTFGIWNLDHAQTLGYEMAVNEDDMRIDALEAELPESWWHKLDVCLAESTQLELMVPFSNRNPTPVDKGMIESFESASNTAQWKSLVQEWRDCMNGKGVQVEKSNTNFVPKLTEDILVNIEIAIIDVTCKSDLQTVQKLADILASHEERFVRKNISALNSHRAQIDETVIKAREIITAGG